MRNPKEKRKRKFNSKDKNESFADKKRDFFIEKCCDEQKVFSILHCKQIDSLDTIN